jgi:purine-nucleoside phosphorylase
MSVPYDKEINGALIKIAKDNKIALHRGVYASVYGPQLETKAEYRMLSIIGADAVGMSTVPEVIVANHLGIRVAAVSVLTDECNPNNLNPIDVDDIIKMASLAEPNVIILFKSLLKEL